MNALMFFKFKLYSPISCLLHLVSTISFSLDLSLLGKDNALALCGRLGVAVSVPLGFGFGGGRLLCWCISAFFFSGIPQWDSVMSSSAGEDKSALIRRA